MTVNRSLTVQVDGRSISDGCRIRFSCEKSLSLYPSLQTVSILNLSDSGCNALRMGGELTVLRETSTLAQGTIRDIRQCKSALGVWTEAGFSLGLDLWEARVCLSLERGKTVTEVLQAILTDSGTPWALLNRLPSDQPTFPRGWALYGRAGELIEQVLRSAGASACLVPSGIVLSLPSSPIEAEITASDMTDRPTFTSSYAILQTNLVDWPVGRRAKVKYEGRTLTGRIVKTLIDADTAAGPWTCQVLIRLDEGGANE